MCAMKNLSHIACRVLALLAPLVLVFGPSVDPAAAGRNPQLLAPWMTTVQTLESATPDTRSGQGALWLFFGPSATAKSSTADNLCTLVGGARVSMGDFFRAVTFVCLYRGYTDREIETINSRDFFERFDLRFVPSGMGIKPCVFFRTDGHEENLTLLASSPDIKPIIEQNVPRVAGVIKGLGPDSWFFRRLGALIEKQIRSGKTLVIDARPLPLELAFLRNLDVPRTEIYMNADIFERSYGRILTALLATAPERRGAWVDDMFKQEKLLDGRPLRFVFRSPGMFTATSAKVDWQRARELALLIASRAGMDLADQVLVYHLQVLLFDEGEELLDRDAKDGITDQVIGRAYESCAGQKFRFNPYRYGSPLDTANAVLETVLSAAGGVPLTQAA